MRPLSSRLSLLLVSVVLGGCSIAAAKPPEPPPPIAPQTRVSPGMSKPRASTPELEQPPLLAPPPAYGNKIVMASAGGPSTVH